jgi:rare lipoprotein A (peptidoglycan hydrolase)
MLRPKLISVCALLLIAGDLLIWGTARLFHEQVKVPDAACASPAETSPASSRQASLAAFASAAATTAPNASAGVASWYGQHWQGRKTASGTRFDMRKLTAAHRSLPLNSHARVTNMENGRSVIVLVNDRGPYIAGRAIDLSRAAARHIGMVKQGLAPVCIEIVKKTDNGTARQPI